MQNPSKTEFRIVASIVTYNTNLEHLRVAISSFLKASKDITKHLVITDNHSDEAYLVRLQNLLNDFSGDVTFFRNDKNTGYGSGHNYSFENSPKSDYFLILNPDIEIQQNAIKQAVLFMGNNDDVALVSPKILDVNAHVQRLNKRYPTIFNLFARRFLPDSICRLGFIQKRLNHYTMDDIDYDETQEVPSVSGCFMLFKSDIFAKLQGFDEKFFMYMEDLDISFRAGNLGKVVYYPEISIVHLWERGSHKNFKLMWAHIKSAIIFFNKWGWKIL